MVLSPPRNNHRNCLGREIEEDVSSIEEQDGQG